MGAATAGVVPVVSVAWPRYCCTIGGVKLKHTLALPPPGIATGSGAGIGGVESSTGETANAGPWVSKLATPVTSTAALEVLVSVVHRITAV